MKNLEEEKKRKKKTVLGRRGGEGAAFCVRVVRTFAQKVCWGWGSLRGGNRGRGECFEHQVRNYVQKYRVSAKVAVQQVILDAL